MLLGFFMSSQRRISYSYWPKTFNATPDYSPPALFFLRTHGITALQTNVINQLG